MAIGLLIWIIIIIFIGCSGNYWIIPVILIFSVMGGVVASFNDNH